MARGGETAEVKEFSSGVDKSQCKIAPSDPPDTSNGWTGCQATAAKQHKHKTTKNIEEEKRTANFFLMPFEDTELLHRPDVEYTDSLVPRSTGD